MAASPGPGVAQVVAPPDRVSLGHAVNALYTSHDPTTRSAADEWLQSFLRSDIAWPLSIQLLSNATDLTSLEALFCARALHVLLRKSVVKPRATQASHAVLVEDDWVNMRSALLALAWNFSVKGVLPNGGVNGGANGGMNSANANCTNEAPPRTVLTQVSLAISVLACKMVSWSADGIVTDLITHFTGIGENGDRINAPTSAKEIVSRWMEGNTPNNPDQHLRLDTDQHAFGEHLLATAGEQCLISILAVLPESCHSKELSIHPARRAEVGEGLKKAATPIVFPTLDLLAAKAFEGSNGGGFHDTAPKEHHARASTLNACAAW